MEAVSRKLLGWMELRRGFTLIFPPKNTLAKSLRSTNVFADGNIFG